MAYANLCPDCLSMGPGDCPKCKIPRIGVGGNMTRMPRLTASKSQWKTFFEWYYKHDMEKAQLFKVMNNKITEADRVRYRQRQEAKTTRPIRYVPAPRKVELLNERQVKALEKAIPKFVKELKELLSKVDRLSTYVAILKYDSIVSDGGAIIDVFFSEKEDLFYEDFIDKDDNVLIATAAKVIETDIKTFEKLEKVRTYVRQFERNFETNIIVNFSLDPTFHEIRRLQERSW